MSEVAQANPSAVVTHARRTRTVRWCVQHALAILLVAVAVKGVFLAVFVPIWEVPDEQAHVLYTQSLVEDRRMPVFRGTDLTYSPEVYRSMQESGYIDRRAYMNKTIDPPADNGDPRRVAPALPANPAAHYNPLYYLFEAVPYLALYDHPIASRVMAMRIVSSFLFVVVVYFSYRFALLIRRSRGFALTVAAIVGFHPMASYMFSGVNNDSLFVALSSIVLFRIASMLRGEPTYRSMCVTAALIGFAATVKEPGMVFVPLVLVALAMRNPRPAVSKLAAMFLVLGAVSLFVWGSWFALSARIDPGMHSVVRQGDTSMSGLSVLSYIDLAVVHRLPDVFKSFWGLFGRLDVPLPAGLYAVLGLVIGAAAFGAVKALLRREAGEDEARERRTALIAAISLILMETLYLSLFLWQVLKYAYVDFPNQGRYYFALLPALMALLLYGIEELSGRRNRYLARRLAAVLMVVFSAYSVYPIMYGRYYG